MSNIVASNAQTLARALSIQGDPQELVATLKATAFKGPVSDAQLTALLVVANQYGLNPWTKEIYAFPDRNNGIVPVVGVDGWSRIINSNPQFDGMDFEQDAESCTCIIYRKDRSHPIKVTEWMEECARKGVGPWQSHPKRMLRHKAMIQCARLAFGYTGIYDQDEAERIRETQTTAPQQPQAPQAPDELIERAEAAANQGVQAYKSFWQSGATADERKLLAGNHDAFKKIAESVDRESAVTDVEAKEVTDADHHSRAEIA